MLARFPGQCASDCGVPIKIDDEITTTAEGWSHEHCPETTDSMADRIAMAQPVCPRCTVRHAGEC